MNDERAPNTQLSTQETEAIKATQEIIKRMADNSAKTKTIFIAVTAAMGTFVKVEVSAQTLIALVVYLALTLTLWHMDAKYLQLERKFRSHSNAIVNGCIPALEWWKFNISRYSEESVLNIMWRNFSTRIYMLAAVCATICIAYVGYQLLFGTQNSIIHPFAQMGCPVIVYP